MNARRRVRSKAPTSLFLVPHPVEDPCRQRRLVLWQKPSVVLRDHLGRVLDRVARLLERAGLLQDMGGEHVAYVVRTMGEQASDTYRTGGGVP